MKHFKHIIALLVVSTTLLSCNKDKDIIRKFQERQRDKRIIGVWVPKIGPRRAFKEYRPNGEKWTCFDPVYDKNEKIVRFKTIRKRTYFYTSGDTIYSFTKSDPLYKGGIHKALYKIEGDTLSIRDYEEVFDEFVPEKYKEEYVRVESVN